MSPCLLSYMLPLRSVGRSNGVMVSADKILTTLIQKRHILTRTTILYIYIYTIYIYGSGFSSIIVKIFRLLLKISVERNKIMSLMTNFLDLHTVRQHLVIVHCLFLLLLSGTHFQMMSGVPHHCHNLSLV